MSKLPREMREAREAKSSIGPGWWYVDPKGIEVYSNYPGGTVHIKLTRKQLERALEIMDKYKS